jgi:hypothetical protein
MTPKEMALTEELRLFIFLSVFSADSGGGFSGDVERLGGLADSNAILEEAGDARVSTGEKRGESVAFGEEGERGENDSFPKRGSGAGEREAEGERGERGEMGERGDLGVWGGDMTGCDRLECDVEGVVPFRKRDAVGAFMELGRMEKEAFRRDGEEDTAAVGLKKERRNDCFDFGEHNKSSSAETSLGRCSSGKCAKVSLSCEYKSVRSVGLNSVTRFSISG